MMLDRRQSLGVLGAGSVLLAGFGGQTGSDKDVGAPQSPVPSAFAGKHEIAPLPFDPKGLKGISEKMIVSHHDNNYGGAVRNLNKVEAELARVTADTPGFVVGGLKQGELQFRNSKVLHELYFQNLGGDGKAGGAVETALAASYGSLARWEVTFRATGASLGGGSGWAVVALDLTTGTLHTYWSGNHTQAHATSAPLLVMDMYEHAYQMDYGAAATKYIDAFLANLRWDEVNRRWERARKAAQALAG
jgi:superoxide dismutase, Fe-Mn family